MTKIRKQRKRKTYRYNVNRKRMNKKINGQPKVHCDQLKGVWDKHKSIETNLKEVGLVYDANKKIKIPSNKPQFTVTEQEPTVVPQKAHVVKDLEEEANAPRERKFQLPKTQVLWLSNCLDKYGEDYEAMAKDKKLNKFQFTQKQLQSKIKVFKSIPEQFSAYLKRRQEL